MMRREGTGWLNPEGQFFKCRQHSKEAHQLAEKLYPHDFYNGKDPEQILENHGWIKCIQKCWRWAGIGGLTEPQFREMQRLADEWNEFINWEGHHMSMSDIRKAIRFKQNFEVRVDE